jgi:hypothetical protein
MARPGRFPADVDDGGALHRQGEAMRDRLLRIGEQAAIGEGIGRDVDDAHDERPRID